MVVALLLVVVLAAVLVPPARRAHAARRDAFLDSFDTGEGADGSDAVVRPGRVRPPHIQRRRDILSSLLVAMVGTGLAGLLPTFRVLLIVHLFVDDFFLAYVALLAHLGNRRARALAPVPLAVPAEVEAERVAEPAPVRPVALPAGLGRARRRPSAGPTRLRPSPVMADLPPVAAAG